MPPSHQQSQIMGQSDSAMMRARSTGVDTRAALEVERLAWWPVHACLRPGKVELLSAVVVVDGRTQSRGRHWLLLSLALFPSLPPPLIAHTTHTTTHFPIHPTPLSPFDSYAPVFAPPVRPTDHQTRPPSSLSSTTTTDTTHAARLRAPRPYSHLRPMPHHDTLTNISLRPRNAPSSARIGARRSAAVLQSLLTAKPAFLCPRRRV